MSENEQPVVDKTNPTQGEWLEVLAGLREEAIAGRLKSLTFALVDSRMPDNAMIDSYGRVELTEIACRMTVHRIADSIQASNQGLADAIRAGLPTATTQKPKLILPR